MKNASREGVSMDVSVAINTGNQYTTVTRDVEREIDLAGALVRCLAAVADAVGRDDIEAVARAARDALLAHQAVAGNPTEGGTVNAPRWKAPLRNAEGRPLADWELRILEEKQRRASEDSP